MSRLNDDVIMTHSNKLGGKFNILSRFEKREKDWYDQLLIFAAGTNSPKSTKALEFPGRKFMEQEEMSQQQTKFIK